MTSGTPSRALTEIVSPASFNTAEQLCRATLPRRNVEPGSVPPPSRRWPDDAIGFAAAVRAAPCPHWLRSVTPPAAMAAIGFVLSGSSPGPTRPGQTLVALEGAQPGHQGGIEWRATNRGDGGRAGAADPDQLELRFGEPRRDGRMRR